MFRRAIQAVLVLSLGVAPGAAAQQAEPFANYDFTRGDRILFAEDLGQDRVGNFARRLALVRGNAEIVELGGQRFLRATSEPTIFDIVLPERLPARFTIEFDINLKETRLVESTLHAVVGVEGPDEIGQYANFSHGEPQVPSSTIWWNAHGAGIAGGHGASAEKMGLRPGVDEPLLDVTAHVRVQADSAYLKMYVNENRVANIPNADFARSNRLRFVINSTAEEPSMVGNFVIAAGGQPLYDALVSNGRVATQGIYFDTGSDRLRPESTPTLRQIGEMLRAHPELRLTIEGHTDNAGNPAANQALSERRAAAMARYLVTTFGVEATRLVPRGLGDTRPAAPNTTGEGRQQNRRVELVKM
jgi:outer membrane protein OmpA-like peptidoglycan-associated protein